MEIGLKIQKIRKELGLLQKQIASELNLDKSSYSKIESGGRDVKVKELQILSALFNMKIDDIVNYETGIPQEVVIEDKAASEQLKLISQLDEDDKQTIFKLIEKMLTNKKFKAFFKENVDA